MLAEITLIGNAGKTPEMGEAGGTSFARFSVAANYKEKGEKKTDWYTVTAFGKLGEIASSMVRQGTLVYVQGEQRVRLDDKGKSWVNVVASKIRVLSSKEQDTSLGGF